MTPGKAAIIIALLLAGMSHATEYRIGISSNPREALPGDDIEIVANINNTGTETARQVRAVLDSSGPGLELMHIEESLGTLNPGDNKTAVFTARLLNLTNTEITIRIMSPGMETKKYIYAFPITEKTEPAGINGTLARMTEAEDMLGNARKERAPDCAEGEAQLKTAEDYYSASLGNWTEYQKNGDIALLAKVMENAENSISHTRQAIAAFRECAGAQSPTLEKAEQIEYVLDFMDRTGKNYTASAREKLEWVKNNPSNVMAEDELDWVVEQIKEPAISAMLDETVRISKKTNDFAREFEVLKDNWGMSDLQRQEIAEKIASAKKHLANASENIDDGEKFLGKANIAIREIYAADEDITMAKGIFDGATRSAYIKLLAAGVILAAALTGLIVLMYAEYKRYMERKRKLMDTPEGLYYKKHRIGGR